MNSGNTELVDTLARFFIRETRMGLVSVYLFGSHSSGRAHRESDVDVAALLDLQSYPTRRERFNERLRLTAALISVLGINDIDAVILNDAAPLLAAKIVTSGRQIFCSDSHRDRAFLRDVQLRAADLAPFLRRARRVKL